MELPTPVRKLKDTLMGVKVFRTNLGNECVIACSRSGRLFRGNVQKSFEEVAKVILFLFINLLFIIYNYVTCVYVFISSFNICFF